MKIPHAYHRMLGLAIGLGGTLLTFTLSYSPALYFPLMRKGQFLILAIVLSVILVMYLSRMRQLPIVQGIAIGFIAASVLIMTLVSAVKAGLI